MLNFFYHSFYGSTCSTRSNDIPGLCLVNERLIHLFLEQFKTHSSTIEPKAAPVEGSVDPAVPHVSSQDTHPPLEVTEASGLTTQTRVADWFWD